MYSATSSQPATTRALSLDNKKGPWLGERDNFGSGHILLISAWLWHGKTLFFMARLIPHFVIVPGAKLRYITSTAVCTDN
jgi:hypothetical protein